MSLRKKYSRVGPGRGTALISHRPIIFADDFDRSDSDTTLGGDWTVSGGIVFGVDSGRAYALPPATSTASAVAFHDVETADVDLSCSVVLSTAANAARGGVYFRGGGSTSNGWFVLMDAGGTTIRLTKVVSGSGTDVDTASWNAAAGQSYAIRVKAKGSTIRAYVDGVLTLSATDSDLATETDCGLWASVGSTDDSPHFDDFVLRAA